MKRSKRLYTLLGLLAVVLIATIGVLNYEEKKEEIKESGEAVLEIPAENVTGLSWEADGEVFSFRKNDGWKKDSDENFPVNEGEIEKLLAVFEKVSASFIIENVEDFDQYGLENPEGIVTLVTDEKNYEIKFGDFSTMDSQRYISIGDGNVYLAAEDPMEAFDVTLSDLIAHDEMPDMEEASSITFKGAQDYTITRE